MGGRPSGWMDAKEDERPLLVGEEMGWGGTCSGRWCRTGGWLGNRWGNLIGLEHLAK